MDFLSVSACVQAGKFARAPQPDLGALILLSSHKRLPRCGWTRAEDPGADGQR